MRCCLLYEYDLYTEIKQKMPKKNKMVITPLGEGKVIEMNFMLETILVEILNVGLRTFRSDEITKVDEHPEH